MTSGENRKCEKIFMDTYFNDFHLLSVKFPSAGKELSKIYIKFSARISLIIFHFWFTEISDLDSAGTDSSHDFT